ncbi:hypothetical protein L6164_017192 [Bauhinia variegata]|uniref:Uncharacterized protein n=1 Tax=Bauhinia variegata TaxID=167791 RepID=A0ACB9N942_BAUVA|nr:hypothetical protein L6164_017192 [Bauhinia variegata]
MDCQKKIRLDLLNEDEAWALFKKHAHLDNQSSLSLLSSVAQDIARECKGLPIAIQAVGRSLRGQSNHEWKIALVNLRSSKLVDVEDGQGDAFSCLKLSYDYLKDDDKLLLLICCIFPEDYAISNEDLIRCGVGLGVYGEYQSFDLARSQVMVGINKLVDSCLLMPSNRRQTNQISTQFGAAKLEILWIETGGSLDFSSASFEAIGELSEIEELYVSGVEYDEIGWVDPSPSFVDNINISSLSASMKNLLQKAEYVHFRGDCQNFVPNVVRAVGGMKDLVVLYLDSCSEMECVVDTTSKQVDVELPASVGLHLWYMTNLKEVCRGPPPVGFFEKLQELFIDYFQQLHNIFPRECKLPKHKILNIHGCRAAVLFSVSVAQSLSQLEELIIGHCEELKHIITEQEDGGDTNTGKEIVPASHNSHLILPNLKTLSVRSCEKLESICPISCIEGLEKLEEIELVNDSQLKYVFGQYDQRDHSSRQKNIQIQFPMLKELTLNGLYNLRGICPEKYHPRQSLSLHYLQKLNVTKCDKLKCLFPIIVSKSLPELTSLKVDYCEELEELMEENIDHKNLSDAQVCFPKLKLIQMSFCKKLKSLLPVAWARMLPQLSVLYISHADKLKVVFSKSSEEGTSNGHEIVIPNLEMLKFIKLPSFVGICPGFKLHAVNLVKIIIDECPKFAPMIDTTQVVPQPCTQIGPHASANSQKISEEQEKNVIWSVKWMYLKQLQYLKKLKTVFCAGVIRSICLPQLKYLYVENCEELKEIISNQAQEGSSTCTSMAHSQHVYLPKLVYLSIWRCSKLKSVFSISFVKHLPELEHMEIRKCSQLEQVFCCRIEDNGGVAMKVNLLPKLKGLLLVGLPSLTHFFRDSNQLQFPALQHFTVEDCSNFSPDSFQLPLQGYYSSGEPWIPYFERFSPTPILERGFGHNLDAAMFIKGTKIWDEAKVRRLYTKKAADIILRNHVPESSKSCAYFIYHNNCFVNGLDLSTIPQNLENARLLQRHKFLWFSVLLGTLPVKSQLKKIFKSEKFSTCFLCNLTPETADHLFLHCSFIRSLWFMSPWGLRAEKWSSLTMLQWFEFLTDDSLVANSIGISSQELLLFASVMMDKVWDERNRIAHAYDSNHLDV